MKSSGVSGAILKTGSAPRSVRDVHGDFEAWIAHILRCTTPLVTVDMVAGELPPRMEELAGVVITGSPAMLSERPEWCAAAANWIAIAVDAGVPVLGICFGHQLLAQALGGEVGPNPRGREMGTVVVEGSANAANDPLFMGLPTRFAVQASHQESVLTLPSGALCLASSDLDPHHAFRFGDRTWGVQFHPEFSAEVMVGYIEERAGDLRQEGFDPERMAAEVSEAKHGETILERFGRFFLRR